MLGRLIEEDFKVLRAPRESKAAGTILDSAIDTAISGAIQVGFTAAGTASIPIAGVSTAVGGLGIFANIPLTTRFGEKSAMDHIKGWFH